MVLNLRRKWLNSFNGFQSLEEMVNGFPCLEQGPGKSRIAGKTDDSSPGKTNIKLWMTR